MQDEVWLRSDGDGGIEQSSPHDPAAARFVRAGWQPIETAPKDGSVVLLGNSFGSWVGHYVGRYQSGYVPDQKWHSMMLNHGHLPKEASYKPTHWMPLPPPPIERHILDEISGKNLRIA